MNGGRGKSVGFKSSFSLRVGTLRMHCAVYHVNSLLELWKSGSYKLVRKYSKKAYTYTQLYYQLSIFPNTSVNISENLSKHNFFIFCVLSAHVFFPAQLIAFQGNFPSTQCESATSPHADLALVNWGEAINFFLVKLKFEFFFYFSRNFNGKTH